jgi:hypothetical protein
MAAEIFAGNAPSAWRLLELAWPASFPGRAAFAADFRDQLKTSPWWNDVVALNPSGL